MRCDGAAVWICLHSGYRSSEFDCRYDSVEARLQARINDFDQEASQSVSNLSFFQYDKVLQQDSHGINGEAVA